MDKYLTASEVADLLNLSVPTIRLWIKDGKLPASDVSSGTGRPAYRIRREDLDTFLDERKTTTP